MQGEHVFDPHAKTVIDSLLGHPEISSQTVHKTGYTSPNAHEEIAHRSNSVTLLAQIGRELGRPLRWDPVTETFPDDDDANGLLEVPRREGYELPDLS